VQKGQATLSGLDFEVGRAKNGRQVVDTLGLSNTSRSSMSRLLDEKVRLSIRCGRDGRISFGALLVESLEHHLEIYNSRAFYTLCRQKLMELSEGLYHRHALG
jgi:hypothetical protein